MSTTTSDNRRPTIGECVTHALIWEATAAKPGNVHRGADFEDMTFADMTTAAVAIGGAFERHAEAPLGELVLAGVEAMRASVDRNTHLGTLLLVAPLAIAARHGGRLIDGAVAVLASATDDDTRLVYEAIRRAKPGGIGRVKEGDVAEPPKVSLLEAMKLAADRDLVARQYAEGFHEVDSTAESIRCRAEGGFSLHDAIVATHVWLMSREPDSLIARKCGSGVAQESADRAAEVLTTGSKASEEFWAAVADLDFWLRADGHRRNPGTTADIIGASLFVLLVEGRINWPVRFYAKPHPPIVPANPPSPYK